MYTDWIPTVENINRLPDRIRRYVHDLQTNCDPAGMVAENTLLSDQTRMLDKYIAHLKGRTVMYDKRKCPDNEVLPLFKKMLTNKPVDVRWNDGDRHLTYIQDGFKLIVWIQSCGSNYFDFITGVDNICFHGRLYDDDIIEQLKEHSKDGIGTKVSDFIDLGDKS